MKKPGDKGTRKYNELHTEQAVTSVVCICVYQREMAGQDWCWETALSKAQSQYMLQCLEALKYR